MGTAPSAGDGQMNLPRSRRLALQRHPQAVVPKNFQQVAAFPAEHVKIADMWIAVQQLLNLQGDDCSSRAACRSRQSPARREHQTAGQSSAQHAHHAPQRHQANIVPNLDRCSVGQRDLDPDVGYCRIPPILRRRLDMHRAVAIRWFADRPHGQEYRRWLRPEHAAPHLAAPVPQQTTADLVTSARSRQCRRQVVQPPLQSGASPPSSNAAAVQPR